MFECVRFCGGCQWLVPQLRVHAHAGPHQGQGLGAKGAGRLEPVEVAVLPERVSLDFVSETKDDRRRARTCGACVVATSARSLRRHGCSGNKRKREKRRLRRLADAVEDVVPRSDVFDFMNNKLFRRTGTPNLGASTRVSLDAPAAKPGFYQPKSKAAPANTKPKKKSR